MKYELVSIFAETPEEAGAEIVSPPMSLEQGLAIYCRVLKCKPPKIDLQKLEGRVWTGNVGNEEVILRPVDEEEEPVGAMWIDDAVKAMSEEKFMLAWRRAERAFGDCVADYESEEFEHELHEQLKLMVVKDDMESLVKKGIAVPAGVDEDGEIIYHLTEEAKQILEKEHDGN